MTRYFDASALVKRYVRERGSVTVRRLLASHVAATSRLSEVEIDVILMDIARHAIVLAPIETAQAPVAPDPGDQFLWNLLATRADLVLVTGDKLLLKDALMQSRVILPQTFVAQLQH